MDEEQEVIHVVQRTERHLRTYADLWRGARFFMRDAEERELGSYFKYTGAFLMTAFTVEAYCNYIGPILLGDAWLNPERLIERKPPTKKLKIIGKEVGVSVDFDLDPWRRIKSLFSARDQVVHAKRGDVRAPEQRFSIKRSELMSQNYVVVDAPWEDFCRVYYLSETMDMVESALRQIHERLPAENKAEFGELFVSGMTVGSISIDTTRRP